MEHEFYKFMKFDTSVLYDRYSFYLKFFKDCKNVLDLGCGKGEFLELIRKEGKCGLGVDSDEGMIRTCEEKGLEVACRDVLIFLKETERKFDGIFCAHLIEHLPHDRVIELLSLCSRALEENGVLVIATPNPAALHTQLCEFWSDPSHIRMYSRELLEFLTHYAGFATIESGENPGSRVPPPIGLGSLESKPIVKMRSERYSGPIKRLKQRVVFFINQDINTRIEAINSNLEAIRKLINRYYPAIEVYTVGRKKK